MHYVKKERKKYRMKKEELSNFMIMIVRTLSLPPLLQNVVKAVEMSRQGMYYC